MTTNKTNNNNVKVMTCKEIMGMTVKVNEKPTALVKFVTDDVYIDTSVKVTADNAFPKKAVGDAFHPVYYVCALNVEFAHDVKNVTTGDKDERKQKNDEIMKNATGFKAVCRDLTSMAGKSDKGFLKITAGMPCDEKINPNKCICGLWVFTSKTLREKWLREVQNGINNGKYRLYTGEKKSNKPLQAVLTLQASLKACGIDKTYDECEQIYKANKASKK